MTDIEILEFILRYFKGKLVSIGMTLTIMSGIIRRH